jgi:type IV secretion system protein TrbL
MEACDVPGVSAVCGAAEQAAVSAVAAPVAWFADAMGDTAAWMVTQLWTVLGTTTRVDVTSDAYLRVYNVLFGVAVSLTLILFFVQLIGGVLRRDPRALATATLGVAKSMVGGFVVVSLTGTALEITDQLAVGIVEASGQTMQQMGGRLALLVAGLSTASVTPPGVGVVMTVLLAGLAIVAAGLVWVSLLVRKAVLLVAIVMAPIAISGLVWSATRDWVRRWASLVAALIVSKLVLVVVLLVATAQVSAPVSGDLASVSDPIAGIVLLFVAAFSPYMAYKFIAFAGVDVAQAISVEQDVKRAVTPSRAMTTPRMAARLLGASAGGGPAAVIGSTAATSSTVGGTALGRTADSVIAGSRAATGAAPSGGTARTGGSSTAAPSVPHPRRDGKSRTSGAGGDR